MPAFLTAPRTLAVSAVELREIAGNARSCSCRPNSHPAAQGTESSGCDHHHRVIDPPAKSQRNHIIHRRFHTVRARRCISWVMDASAQTRRSAESRDPPDKVPAIARGVGKNFADMRPPPFKRVFALCQKIVALIHGSDTGDCPGLVVENLVSHVRRDT
jgi:hypothetical protein